MNFTCYKLYFKSPLHIGDREQFFEDTLTYIPSDTLFSAFCHSYLLLFGKSELEIMLTNFYNCTPPFLISSCFPFSNSTFFLPVPKNPEHISHSEDYKKYKKVQYVEKSAFERLITNTQSEIQYTDNTVPSLDRDNTQKIYSINVLPRVSLSRLNNSPGENYFHFGEVTFKENCGLYFLVDFKNDEFKELFFDAVLRLMQDEGIGGDRSVGKGIFTYKKEENFAIEVNANAKWCVNLSLYSPKENEIDNLRDGYYELVERKGYIFSPEIKSLRKKSAVFFKEGSIFPSKKIGRLLNVTPETSPHSVYQYGFALTLPYNL